MAPLVNASPSGERRMEPTLKNAAVVLALSLCGLVGCSRGQQPPLELVHSRDSDEFWREVVMEQQGEQQVFVFRSIPKGNSGWVWSVRLKGSKEVEQFRSILSKYKDLASKVGQTGKQTANTKLGRTTFHDFWFVVADDGGPCIEFNDPKNYRRKGRSLLGAATIEVFVDLVAQAMNMPQRLVDFQNYSASQDAKKTPAAPASEQSQPVATDEPLHPAGTTTASKTEVTDPLKQAVNVADNAESRVSVDLAQQRKEPHLQVSPRPAGHKPKEDFEEAGRILVTQIKPGMSTRSVVSLLGEPTTREQIDLSQFTGSGSPANPAMEIMQWKYGVPADNCFITLSFTSDRLKDGGTAGYNIHKGFTTKEGKPLMQAVKEMGDKLDAEGGK
jgi:hypothetical protein